MPIEPTRPNRVYVFHAAVYRDPSWVFLREL